MPNTFILVTRSTFTHGGGCCVDWLCLSRALNMHELLGFRPVQLQIVFPRQDLDVGYLIHSRAWYDSRNNRISIICKFENTVHGRHWIHKSAVMYNAGPSSELWCVGVGIWCRYWCRYLKISDIGSVFWYTDTPLAQSLESRYVGPIVCSLCLLLCSWFSKTNAVYVYFYCRHIIIIVVIKLPKTRIPHKTQCARGTILYSRCRCDKAEIQHQQPP